MYEKTMEVLAEIKEHRRDPEYRKALRKFIRLTTS